MKNILKILKYIGISILVILALIFICIFIQTKISPNKVPSIIGYKPFIVLSGSMETELYKGDLAIVKKIDPTKLKVRDIIAFRDDEGHIVTHRIIEAAYDGENTRFITKGDNNNANDNGSVGFDQVEGKYLFKISGFGNVLLVMQKPITLCISLIIILLLGTLWIVFGNNKLSKEERKELEELRNEKKKNK